MLLRKGNEEAQGRHHELFIKGLDNSRKQGGNVPVVSTILVQRWHKLLKQSEARHTYKQLNLTETGERRSSFPPTGGSGEGSADSSHSQAREVSSSLNDMQLWQDFWLDKILPRLYQTGAHWAAVSGRCCTRLFIDIDLQLVICHTEQRDQESDEGLM